MVEANDSLSQPFFTENSPAMAKRKPSKIIRKPVAPPINEWPAERNSRTKTKWPAIGHFFVTDILNEMEQQT
jgi:hypothetical protein